MYFRELFPMFLRTSSMRGKDQRQISRKPLTLGAGVEGGLRHRWLKVGRQDRREVKSHGEQPTRSQVDWAIRLTQSQVSADAKSSCYTGRKLGSCTSSAINQLTLFGVHPQNQTQTLTVDDGTLFIHPHLTPTLH
jgi:hypothetical protein